MEDKLGVGWSKAPESGRKVVRGKPSRAFGAGHNSFEGRFEQRLLKSSSHFIGVWQPTDGGVRKRASQAIGQIEIDAHPLAGSDGLSFTGNAIVGDEPIAYPQVDGIEESEPGHHGKGGQQWDGDHRYILKTMQPGGVNVIGSANMDLVVRTARFPQPGETLLGAEFSTTPGGKGANQACAIGRLGGAPRFIGKVGKDPFGDSLRASLEQKGVDCTKLILDPDHPSGVALITVDGSGENMILVASGANMTLTEEEVRSATKDTQPTVTLCQLEIPLEAVWAASGCDSPFFVLNPAPSLDLPEALLERVTLLTPNQHEAMSLTGTFADSDSACREACAALHLRGVRAVVLTLGAGGCFWSDGRAQGHVPAFKVESVDTTGAGDAFNGALCHFLAEGVDLQEALVLASAAAAVCVTRVGAQAAMPSLGEVLALRKTHS